MTHFIDHLEKGVDWNRVFGVVDSLYTDPGFTSNADNFARATMVEKALDKNSDLIRVDKTCLLYTSPSPRDKRQSRMPSSA